MMTGRELVTRALEFRNPDRLPFIQHKIPDLPDDVLECFEVDRAKAGWFLDHPDWDDWGCLWQSVDPSHKHDIGQVVHHPLDDWSAFDRAAASQWRPPNPRDPFYYERIEPVLAQAGGRYVMLSSSMVLNERHRALRGFDKALLDYYLEPERTNRLLDMMTEFHIDQIDEIHRRFGDRVHGIWTSEDLGTQEAPFLPPDVVEEYYLARYRAFADAAHAHGYHIIMHSCGKINALIPILIRAGIDCMNMQQTRTYGIRELGEIARGKIAFFAAADHQTTLPQGDPEQIRKDVFEVMEHWGTEAGGIVAFGMDKHVFGASDESHEIMLRAFKEASEKMGKPRAPTKSPER